MTARHKVPVCYRLQMVRLGHIVRRQFVRRNRRRGRDALGWGQWLVVVRRLDVRVEPELAGAFHHAELGVRNLGHPGVDAVVVTRKMPPHLGLRVSRQLPLDLRRLAVEGQRHHLEAGRTQLYKGWKSQTG